MSDERDSYAVKEWLPFSEMPQGKAAVIYSEASNALTIGKINDEGVLETLTPILWTPTHFSPLPDPPDPAAPARLGITGLVPTVTGENIKVVPDA